MPLKRREALPGVECCVDCQQLRERSGVGNG
ncbi:TraR/DksA C4-type zinc finger protein [Halopseudomonas aestusnigri]|nr:TraR/DksA C4-type zinc finger protein [Halopseudomonas aestusnigri]